jgi:hypothetical protein
MRAFSRSLLVLVLIVTTGGVAHAGGWATVTPDEGAASPQQGEAFQFGFTVLQHGVTPAGWVTATFLADNILTGDTLSIDVPAGDAAGHFTVDVTFPASGYWAWRIELLELVTETPARGIGVRDMDGQLPPFDGALFISALEQAKSDLRDEATDLYGVRLTGLADRLDAATARIAELERRLGDLERSASTVR